jgi:cytoskeletal protein CcmA (bactofilin family)
MSVAHDTVTERNSVLGPTLRFKGELTASEDLVVHGQVEGTIGPVPKVTIGPEAYVKAGVNADVIVVEGRVEGDLKAQVAITLRSRANVRGNLEAPSINIAEGAAFNGGVKMEPARTEASVRPMRSGEPGPARTGTAD